MIDFLTNWNIDTSLIFSILHFEYFKAQSLVNEGAEIYLTGSNPKLSNIIFLKLLKISDSNVISLFK